MFKSISLWFKKLFKSKGHTGKGVIYETHGTAQYIVDYKCELGKGSFGSVYKALSLPDNTTLAVKVLHQNDDQVREQLEKEAKRIRNYFTNVHFVTLIKPFPIPTNSLGLFMEFVEGDTLDEISQPFPNVSFQNRIHMAWQLADQLNSIHHNTPRTGKALIHHDLSPRNIMIQSHQHKRESYYNARIIDFGLAEEHVGCDAQDPNALFSGINTGGTARVVAPERVGLVAMPNRGTKSDVYSLGCSILDLFGMPDALNLKEHYYNTRQWQHYFSTSAHFDPEFTNIIVPIICNVDIKPFLSRFLKRMIHTTFNPDMDATILQNDYNNRPSTTEVLRFFTCLQKLICLSSIINFDKNEQQRLIVECRLLADNLWNDFSKTDIDLDDATDLRYNLFCIPTRQTLTKNEFETYLSPEKDENVRKIINCCFENRLDRKPVYQFLRSNVANHNTRQLLANNQELLKLMHPFIVNQSVNLELLALLPKNTPKATCLLRALNQFKHPDLQTKLHIVLHSFFTYSDEESHEEALSSLSDTERLQIHEFIFLEREALSFALSPETVSLLLKELISPLIAKSIGHYQQELDTLLEKHKPDYHQRSLFGFSIGEKKQAVDCLVTAYKQGNFATLFCNENLTLRKALHQGRLKNLAATLFQHAEELYKSSPAA